MRPLPLAIVPLLAACSGTALDGASTDHTGAAPADSAPADSAPVGQTGAAVEPPVSILDWYWCQTIGRDNFPDGCEEFSLGDFGFASQSFAEGTREVALSTHHHFDFSQSFNTLEVRGRASRPVEVTVALRYGAENYWNAADHGSPWIAASFILSETSETHSVALESLRDHNDVPLNPMESHFVHLMVTDASGVELVIEEIAMRPAN